MRHSLYLTSSKYRQNIRDDVVDIKLPAPPFSQTTQDRLVVNENEETSTQKQVTKLGQCLLDCNSFIRDNLGLPRGQFIDFVRQGLGIGPEPKDFILQDEDTSCTPPTLGVNVKDGRWDIRRGHPDGAGFVP